MREREWFFFPLVEEAATALTAKDKEIEELREENAAINGELNEWVKHAGSYWQGCTETAERERNEARAAINTIDKIVHTPTAGNERAQRHFQRDFDAIRKIAVPFRAARAVIKQGEQL